MLIAHPENTELKQPPTPASISADALRDWNLFLQMRTAPHARKLCGAICDCCDLNTIRFAIELIPELIDVSAKRVKAALEDAFVEIGRANEQIPYCSCILGNLASRLCAGEVDNLEQQEIAAGYFHSVHIALCGKYQMVVQMMSD